MHLAGDVLEEPGRDLSHAKRESYKFNSTNGIFLLRSKKPLVVQHCTALNRFLHRRFHVASHAGLHTHSSAAKTESKSPPSQKIFSTSKKLTTPNTVKSVHFSDVHLTEDPWPAHQGARELDPDVPGEDQIPAGLTGLREEAPLCGCLHHLLPALHVPRGSLRQQVSGWSQAEDHQVSTHSLTFILN